MGERRVGAEERWEEQLLTECTEECSRCDWWLFGDWLHLGPR